MGASEPRSWHGSVVSSVEILVTELAEREGVVAGEDVEEVEELAIGDVPITDELI